MAFAMVRDFIKETIPMGGWEHGQSTTNSRRKKRGAFWSFRILRFSIVFAQLTKQRCLVLHFHSFLHSGGSGESITSKVAVSKVACSNCGKSILLRGKAVVLGCKEFLYMMPLMSGFYRSSFCWNWVWWFRTITFCRLLYLVLEMTLNINREVNLCIFLCLIM